MSPLKAFVILASVIFFASFILWTQFSREKPSLKTLVSTEITETKVGVDVDADKDEVDTEIVVEKSPPSTPDLEKSVFTDVPFTVQAPFSQWSDPRFQDACEEAVSLMAMKWVLGTSFLSKADANDEIIKIIDWQIEKYGSYHDTGAADTAKRIFNEYFNYHNVSVKENITTLDIIDDLQKGNLVIAPANGQGLKNPFFTQPGPERHMVLIIGYDAKTSEFITNDPGVSQGKNYRYPTDVLISAIRDYPSGDHLPIEPVSKKGIIVKKLGN